MPPESLSALSADHAEYPSSDLHDFHRTPCSDATYGGRNHNHHTPINSEKDLPKTTLGITPSPKSPIHSNVSEVLVLALHIVLVAIHIVLLVTLLTRLESRIVMPLSEGSGLISTVIVVSSQIFVIAFTAILLFLTQREANRKMMTKQQFLTIDHDTVTAWTGLGAALMTLVRQYTVPAAVASVTAISAYLAGLVILHTTTPSLFSLQLFNETYELAIPTQKYSNIDIDMNNLMNQTVNSESDATTWPSFQSQSPTQALPFIAQMDQPFTLGLSNNTLYDIIGKNNGTGAATVKALSFTTSCGSIPANNYSIVPGGTNLIWKPVSDISCNFSNVPYLDGRNPDTSLVGGPLSIFRQDPHLSPFSVSTVHDYIPLCVNNSISNDSVRVIEPPDTIINGILFTSALVFTDSNGAHGSLAPLASGNEENITQIMGCTLSYEKLNVNVDVQSREMISSSTSFMKNESFWSPWEPAIMMNQPDEAFNWHLDNIGLLDSWPLILAPDQSDWVETDGQCTGDDNVSHCWPASIPFQEQFIMDRLPNYNSSSTSAYGYSLKDLENVLASMIASYYWAALQMMPQNFPESSSMSENTIVIQYTLKYRLKLNLVPVVVGLATSIMLTALALFLIRGKSHGSHEPVSSLGVLQTIWLLNRYPDVSQTVASVEVPTLDNLRAAGMVPIQLDSFRQRHINGRRSSADGLLDEDTIELATSVPLLNTTNQ